MKQAKLLLNTLNMIKEKTKGNLNGKEVDLLNMYLVEVQTKYMDICNEEGLL